MTTYENESCLPTVAEVDLLLMTFEDFTDPDHRERWRRFAQNSVLAKEVLKLAFAAGNAEHSPASPPSVEITKRILDIVSFAIDALEIAARRTSQEVLAPSIDGVDVEDQPPST